MWAGRQALLRHKEGEVVGMTIRIWPIEDEYYPILGLKNIMS